MEDRKAEVHLDARESRVLVRFLPGPRRCGLETGARWARLLFRREPKGLRLHKELSNSEVTDEKLDTMKTIIGGIVAVTLLLCAGAYGGSKRTEPQPLAPEEVPQFGNFYSMQAELSDHGWPPLPFNPFAGSEVPVPVYPLGSRSFVYDDSAIDYGDQLTFKRAEKDVRSVIGESAVLNSLTMSVPFPADEGGGGSQTNPPPDLRRNFEKFMGQVFFLIDTNEASLSDTNLYNACLSFPEDTNTAPTLQIARYGTNAVLIKANHFDYSGETERDFTLLVCDRVESPLWKNVDFQGNSDSQDGWLIQGIVPYWEVTDPMFMMVTNLSSTCPGFFRAIPYGGPLVELTGVQPYDVVSNMLVLQAVISDLSGVTNHQYEMDVDGLPVRFSFGTGNTISIETKYNPNGILNVTLTVFSDNAHVHDPASRPADTKLHFAGSGSLPLDFENAMYLASAGDMCSPDVGTNQIMFFVDSAQQIEATIFDPTNAQTVASFAGYVPYAATVIIPWDFTDADGTTPYSNDTYAVTFTAANSESLTITNTIDRQGVRTAAGCILTYEEEDPNDWTGAGAYANAQAATWVGTLAFLYSALYATDWGSPTMYWQGDIGPNRNNPSWAGFPYVLTANNQMNWAYQTCFALTNLAFSDFGYYMGHGNGVELGGGPRGSTFVTSYIESSTIAAHVAARPAFPNWRMRKVAIWACYSDSPAATTAGGTYPSWPAAFGIRRTSQQFRSWMMKNVGLFFGGKLPAGGYCGTLGGTSVEVAAAFDNLWVSGPVQWPGACDPTYSFAWAFNQMRGMYPRVDKGLPTWIGFGYLPYSGVYDAELMTNNVSHVKP